MNQYFPAFAPCASIEEIALTRFRKTLSHHDQQSFDALFDTVKDGCLAFMQSASALPVELFLIALLLEQ